MGTQECLFGKQSREDVWVADRKTAWLADTGLLVPFIYDSAGLRADNSAAAVPLSARSPYDASMSRRATHHGTKRG